MVGLEGDRGRAFRVCGLVVDHRRVWGGDMEGSGRDVGDWVGNMGGWRWYGCGRVVWKHGWMGYAHFWCAKRLLSEQCFIGDWRQGLEVLSKAIHDWNTL